MLDDLDHFLQEANKTPSAYELAKTFGRHHSTISARLKLYNFHPSQGGWVKQVTPRQKLEKLEEQMSQVMQRLSALEMLAGNEDTEDFD
jgi:IS30 family transposase